MSRKGRQLEDLRDVTIVTESPPGLIGQAASLARQLAHAGQAADEAIVTDVVNQLGALRHKISAAVTSNPSVSAYLDRVQAVL